MMKPEVLFAMPKAVFNARSVARLALVFCISLAAYSGKGQANGLLREVYTEIPGEPIINLTTHPSFPDSPTLEEIIVDGFETPSSWGENYGQRVSGYLTAPLNGTYTFWIATDDGGELYLSSDETPANKRLIASVATWT